jgi:hypothetical protein
LVSKTGRNKVAASRDLSPSCGSSERTSDRPTSTENRTDRAKSTTRDEDSEDTVEAQLVYEGLRNCEMAVNATEHKQGERPNHDQGRGPFGSTIDKTGRGYRPAV